MVSRNEGRVTGDGSSQSWLEGVASGGGYSSHKAEGLANRLLHHCTWTEGGLAVGHVTVCGRGFSAQLLSVPVWWEPQVAP